MNSTPTDQIRGLTQLAVQATQAVTTIVEDMHQSIASPWPGRTARHLVYESIRRVTGGVGYVVESALDQSAGFLAPAAPSQQREAVIAALNGVMGDHLEASGNPLATAMSLRFDGHALPLDDASALGRALPQATGRVLVLVHGSSMGDAQWRRKGHSHGAALSAQQGWTPIHLRYNSGLHVSTNGAAFADQLEHLIARWPVPVEELAIVAYSMGGLLTRSACHLAPNALWRSKLSRLVFLGTPHHGAPLERVGNWLDALIGLHPYSAPIGRLARIRSAGITDLRFGNLLDADWRDRDRFALEDDCRHIVPLPSGVRCYAIAGQLRETRLGELAGDGLVPVQSALGQHPMPSRCLGIPPAHQRVVPGVAHLDLLSDARVFEALREWLAP